ncbi:MAG: hypothetical protein U1E87_01520 [Alphaproteobacteria bacterium]
MQTGLKSAAAIALALALAGCTSPKQKIAQNCVKGGNTKEVCKCFTDELGTKLNDKQLKVLAKADDKQGEQAMNELGMEGAAVVMGAAKKCNMASAPGGGTP